MAVTEEQHRAVQEDFRRDTARDARREIKARLRARGITPPPSGDALWSGIETRALGVADEALASVGVPRTVEQEEALAAQVVAGLEELIGDTLDERMAAPAVTPAFNLADVHRGVWSPALLYARGDLCTHDGSLWLAKSSNTGAKPGTSEDWKLIVKRGQDGRKGR